MTHKGQLGPVSSVGPAGHTEGAGTAGRDKESDPGTASFRMDRKLINLLSTYSSEYDCLVCGEMLFLKSTGKILFMTVALSNLCFKG